MSVKFGNLLPGATLLCSTLLLLLAGCCTVEVSKKATRRNHLAIELHIASRTYKPSDVLDAEVVFKNIGTKVLKFPMADPARDKEAKFLFFDFVLLSELGHRYITRDADGWLNPDIKFVKMIPLHPGETYCVKLEKVLDLQEVTGLRSFESLTCDIFVVYRDHSFWHSHTNVEDGNDDPSVWKAAIISNSVPVEIENPE
jgi:hypothetical protein